MYGSQNIMIQKFNYISFLCNSSFGDGFSTLTEMIKSITTYMNKEYHKDQLQQFADRARKLGLTAVEEAIGLAMEQVNNNIYWREHSYYQLKDFLEAIVSEFHINIF